MQTYIVNIHIKQETVDAFIEATIDNVSNSLKEPGITGFDFYQQIDDPTRFLLIEVYKDDQARAVHKESEHYFRWRDKATGMMEEPRVGISYKKIYP